MPSRAPSRTTRSYLSAEDRDAAARLERVIQAARLVIAERRARSGSDGVIQEDVDLAADALVRASLRPFPQLIAQISGGSLSTIKKLFDDWWARFAARRMEAESPGVDLSLRVTLCIRHLVAGLEGAVREQLAGLKAPGDVFAAAAALGERQALTAQIAALGAAREKLSQDLQAMTYKVGMVEARLRAEIEARESVTAALQTALAQLAEALERTGRLLESAPAKYPDIEQLALDVRRLLRSQGARGSTQSQARSRAPGQGSPQRRARVSGVGQKALRRSAKQSRKR